MLLVSASLPSLCVLGRASAQDEGDADPVEAGPSFEVGKKTAAILKAIASNGAVLVNVSRADLPASPDILNLGRRGTEALTRCVSDNVDDGVRSVCATLLGRLGDRRALGALQEALEAWSPEVRESAIVALRRMPEPSSFPALASVLSREDETPENRTLALQTLGLLSDQRAVSLLRKHLREPDSELRPAAFRGVWSSRHLFARQTLVDDVKYALSSGDGLLVLPATHAAAELRDPGLVPALVPLMTNADSRVRNRAVYALGRIGDKAASSALLAQIPKVREARMLNNIAFALERLDPKAFFAAAGKLAQHKQASIRMNAAFVLGDVRRSEGIPLLARALNDENDYVRVSAVAALGKLDAPEALKLVEPYAADKNRTLRKTALLSLLSLSNGQKKDVVYDALVAVPAGDAFTEQARLEGTLALAGLGDGRVTPRVLDCLEHGRCSVRDVDPFLRVQKADFVGGRLMLSWAKGRSDLTNLVGALRPPGAGLLASSEVQFSLGHAPWSRVESAVDLAGAVGEEQAVKALSPLLQHANTDLRVHAALALSRLGQSSADQVLFSEFDNLPSGWLPRVARLLGSVGEPALRERFRPELVRRERGKELSLSLAASAVLLAWEPEAAIFRFLDALASDSVEARELAIMYLNREQRPTTTSLLRRALARETRPFVRDLLRKLLDSRRGTAGAAP